MFIESDNNDIYDINTKNNENTNKTTYQQSSQNQHNDDNCCVKYYNDYLQNKYIITYLYE